jgi:hypothetical protein
LKPAFAIRVVKLEPPAPVWENVGVDHPLAVELGSRIDVVVERKRLCAHFRALGIDELKQVLFECAGLRHRPSFADAD